MRIVVPSMGRAEIARQVTVRNFIRLKSPCEVYLAVPAKEGPRYCNNVACYGRDLVKVIEVPDDVRGISPTRQWILENWADEKDGCVLMIDDDMDFCYRLSMSDPKLVMVHEQPNGGELLEQMLGRLESWLRGGLVHVGLSARQAAAQFPADSGSDQDAETGEPREWRECTRMMNMYAYDVRALSALGVKYGRTPVMEDFDITLQLLRLGKPNRVDFRFCWNQRGSGAVGGCSSYRTAEVQEEGARKLKELHPDFVTLRVKNSKETSASWQGMKSRLDVTVQWREAAMAGGLTLPPSHKRRAA